MTDDDLMLMIRALLAPETREIATKSDTVAFLGAIHGMATVLNRRDVALTREFLDHIRGFLRDHGLVAAPEDN